MRITFVLTQSLESPGGTGRFFPLAKALTQLGHNVTILALHHDYRHAEKRVFDRDGVHVRYVGQMHVRKVGNTKTYFPPVIMVWIAFVATLKLAWWAFRTPADLIQICKSQPMNGLAAWWVHVWKRIPVFIDSDDYEAASNRFSSRWQQRIVAWFEDWMVSFATGLIAGNMFIAERYKALGFSEERTLVLANGVDRARFAILETSDASAILAELRDELGILTTDRVVVYIGSMSGTDHPVDMLLEAFATVVKQLPAAKLLLVGSGEDFEHFQQIAEALHLANRVTFTGRVDANRVPYFYALGELSIDPRRDTLASQSSLSLKLVESLAAGVPVISTDIGDRAMILDGAGIAVKANDMQALADAIYTALSDIDLSRKIQARAQIIRHRGYWDQRAEKLHSFYTVVLDRSV